MLMNKAKGVLSLQVSWPIQVQDNIWYLSAAEFHSSLVLICV